MQWVVKERQWKVRDRQLKRGRRWKAKGSRRCTLVEDPNVREHRRQASDRSAPADLFNHTPEAIRATVLGG